MMIDDEISAQGVNCVPRLWSPDDVNPRDTRMLLMLLGLLLQKKCSEDGENAGLHCSP
jgi:hypothetical protein